MKNYYTVAVGGHPNPTHCPGVQLGGHRNAQGGDVEDVIVNHNETSPML